MYLTQTQILNSAKFCTKQLEDLGYQVPKGIIFKATTRMTKALGNCGEVSRMGVVISRTIKINATMPVSILNDTMIHELIHATIGNKEKHGYKFQQLARVVNRAYGYNVSTYASATESQVMCEVRKNDSKFVEIECESCGKTQAVTIRHGVAKHPENYRCRCGGKLHLK